jgi:hypothetical protein
MECHSVGVVICDPVAHFADFAPSLSTWRPLFGPLQDWPLALMDYTSLDKSRDLVSSDNIYVHRIRENYNVLWNRDHRWYFLESQEPNEVLVFKTFDTHATKDHARRKSITRFAASEEVLKEQQSALMLLSGTRLLRRRLVRGRVSNVYPSLYTQKVPPTRTHLRR